MDAIKLWNEIRQIYSRRIKKVEYDAFIAIVEAEFIEAGFLYLKTPTDVTFDMINSKYIKDLTKTAIELDPSIKGIYALMPSEIESLKETLKEQNSEKNLLNPKYTFDNFVVGNNNRFVYTVALAAASQPAEVYNPLFIYGGVGLGKTHLLHAIGNFIKETAPNLKVKYITAESFMNDLIKNLQGKEASAAFRSRYRSLDVLMIDDIQFIAGKQATQEEFFHTFNALHSLNKQIIIASDRHPNEIERLEERLTSRFQMGLMADIQSPDIETRVAILRKKTELNSIKIGNDELLYIAEKIDSNVRELEGALIKINAMSSMLGKDIDIDIVKDALRNVKPKKIDVQVSLDNILSVVSSNYGISIEDLKSSKRSREISEPRQIAMYLIREILGVPFSKIGKTFGGKDHSTVMHAYAKVSEAIKKSSRFSIAINDIIKMIDIKKK